MVFLLASIIVLSVFPATSSADVLDAAACPETYQPGCQSVWNLSRESWLEACRSGKTAAEILKGAQAAFIADCVKLPAADAIPEETVRALCSQGRPGQDKLLQLAGRAGPPSSARPAAALSGTTKTVLDLGKAVYAHLRADVAGLYGERSAESLAADGVLVSPSAPPPAGLSRPRRQTPGFRGAEVPAPAAYDGEVQKILDLADEYLDPPDRRLVKETLQTYAPVIQFASFESNPLAFGDCDNGRNIRLSRGYAVDNAGRVCALGRKNPAAGGQGRLLALTNPDDFAKEDLGFRHGVQVYRYPDGSLRIEYSKEQLAGTLIHELHHMKRHGEGGGTNLFTDERDAHALQFRFYTRYEQKHGGSIHLAESKAGELSDWQLDPKKFEADLIQEYAQPGPFQHTVVGRATIEEQERALADSRARLELAGGLDARALRRLEEYGEGLKRDKELAGRAEDYQAGWRAEETGAYLTYWGALVKREHDKIVASAKDPDEKERKLAELEETNRSVLANPWRYLMSVDAGPR